MPFDNRGPGGPSISPATQKSVMPFNNVPRIQDVMDGSVSMKDVYPKTRGNWAPGEDVDKSYKAKGDDYKRRARDLDIIKNMTGETDPFPKERWKIKSPGGSTSFDSFDQAQQYMRKNKIPYSYLARIAQIEDNKNSKTKVVADSINKCLMVESVNTTMGVKETGSAFCVAPNYFITCAHVIKNYNKNDDLDGSGFSSDVFVHLVQIRQWYMAEVIDVDLKQDIALLKSAADVDVFELDKEILPGQEIIAIGSPHGYENNISSGAVGSINRKLFTYEGAPDYMFVDLAVFPGNSGGPVVREDNGKVIGMVTLIVSAGGDYGLNAALPSSYIEDFCKKNNLAGF